MEFNRNDTAVVITDPQNEVQSEKGLAWGLAGDSVTENNTVENLERLFTAAKENGYRIFVSPHYYYPTDQAWEFGGPIETMMHESNMFARSGPLNSDGFTGSGADWHDRLAPAINDPQTVVTSPHKLFGPATNDLVVQLGKRKIRRVILGGLLANVCVESHLRELLESGFEVAVVLDATAAPRHPELGDGFHAARINFGFLANAVLTTDEAVAAMKR